METLTILEILQRTEKYFSDRGIESARLNIELLVAHVLGCKRLDLYLRFDRPVYAEELERLRALVKRRAAGEPLQHVLGTVEFYGREFLCDARALIPRPETEQLLEFLLKGLKTADLPGAPEGEPLRLLDVGTGSGVIALTLAAELPDAQVTACDISPDALALARENAAKLELDNPVDWVQSDLLESLTGPFTGIIANLPYIPTADLPGLQAEVQKDPVTALDGGPSGIVIIERLLDQAPQSLTRPGWIALEIGSGQGEMVRETLESKGFQKIIVQNDYSGHDRFVTAVYG